MSRRVTARSAHEIPERAPLSLSAGETVRAGERDTTWPEFVFVTSDHGTGWVPARHLSADQGDVTVATAYETTELPTTPGESLTVMADDPVSGWAWCRNDDAREGWVPWSTLTEDLTSEPTD